MTDANHNVIAFARRRTPPDKSQAEQNSALHFKDFYLDPETFRLTMILSDSNDNIHGTIEFACSKVWPPTFDMTKLIETFAGPRGNLGSAS